MCSSYWWPSLAKKSRRNSKLVFVRCSILCTLTGLYCRITYTSTWWIMQQFKISCFHKRLRSVISGESSEMHCLGMLKSDCEHGMSHCEGLSFLSRVSVRIVPWNRHDNFQDSFHSFVNQTRCSCFTHSLGQSLSGPRPIHHFAIQTMVSSHKALISS